jgi:hypothetical protein
LRCSDFVADDATAKANAAFIVTACNAHDDLLAALQDFRDAYTHHRLDSQKHALAEAARAAIAKAKGGAS